MKQKIKDMIMDIEQKMDKMHTTHLYYLTEQWKVYVAQVDILNQLLNSIR